MHEPLRDADLGAFASSTQQMRDSALLRATTELFVQELVHDRDEIRRYEELATHLLAKVSEGDRLFVAERLASHVDAPLSILRMLAKDKIEIASIVLRASSVLGPLDLLAVIAATGPAHHRLIAERPALPPEVLMALRLSGIAMGAPQPVGLPASSPEPAPYPQSPAAESTPALPPFVVAATTRTAQARTDRFDPWAFLGLDRSARLRLMADLATHEPIRRYDGPTGRLDRAFRAILGAAQIVSYARGGQRMKLVEAVAEGLGLDVTLVAAIFDDATGEPLAIVLKALGLDNTQAQQVFLLATPTIGRDVAAFFRLCDIYAAMEPSVAEVLTEAWRDAGQPAPQHQPVFAENSLVRRTGIAEMLREKWQTPAQQPTRNTGNG